MGVFRELQVSDSEADPVTLSLVDEGQIDRRNRAIRDWFRRPQKVSAKDSLQRLTMERKLDPSKFWDLFGAHENEIALADELLSDCGIKIDLGIVHGQKLLHVMDQALEIVDEAESIFSIAISNVRLGHLLFTHELKAAIGQKGLIWSLGSTIIRVLHSVITAMSSTDIETVEPTKDSTDVSVHKREEYLRKLWQWVQRLKARTLAQHMGLDSISPDRMLLDIQKDLINDNHREQIALMNALKNPSLETRSSMEQRLNQLRHDLTAYLALGYLGFIRNCLRLNEMLPDADLTIKRVTAAYSGSEPKDALDKEKA
ncbi:hypothetical protein VE00_10801 [Pseudogymnoascus sp. WSF 3629]|nr:hypothetical protein VE00_10801 [Pseudogymnoascus sp. WSF 3629]